MRTLRALRPLRAVSRWEGMRVSTGMGQQEVDHTVRRGQGGVELYALSRKIASKLYEMFSEIVPLMR